MYLDASLLPQGVFNTAIYDDFGEGQDAAKILPQYNKDYTVPKSWYDIEKGLYHEDKEQAARDYALGVRVAFEAGRPTEQLEPEEFFNKWYENIDQMDTDVKDASKRIGIN